MQFKSLKTKYTIALFFGIITCLIGLFLIYEYVVNAVIDRIGESDQSLLFWYLPFLILGIAALKLGIGFSIWGFISLRSQRSEISK